MGDLIGAGIVPPGLFAAAQLQLKENSEHCLGRPTKAIYLLRGLLRCSACGGRYAGVPAHGASYYRCVGRDRLATTHCSAPSIPATIVEPFVWNCIVRLLSNPELLTEKLSEQVAEGAGYEDEITRLDKKIAEIRKKEQRLLEALLDDEIQLPGLREKAQQLATESGRLSQIREATQVRAARARGGNQIRETVLRYCEVLAGSLDASQKREILRALVDQISVDGKKISIRGILPGSLANGNRPDRQNVMATRGRNLERALSHGLTANIAEVGRRRPRKDRAVDVGDCRSESFGLVEELNHFA